MGFEISRQTMARGSFGIAPINPLTGRPKAGTEHVITVWRISRDGKHIAAYASRAEARQAMRDMREHG